jgi:hypothetical protein
MALHRLSSKSEGFPRSLVYSGGVDKLTEGSVPWQ